MDKKVIARFEYLATMIAKYSHRWGENPSQRLAGWVDEYNVLRYEHRAEFNAYCELHGYAKDHNGHDVLA
jgi:hypothetical protein